MPWVRLEDDWYDNRKFQAVSAVAELLYLRCLAWCNRNLSDGLIPYATVARLAPEDVADALTQGRLSDTELATGPLAGELVTVGLWHEVDGGYRVHDYSDYQPTSEEVRGARENKRRAGKKGAEARWGKPTIPDDRPIADPMADAMAEPWQNDGPNPNPNPKKVNNVRANALVEQARQLFAYWQVTCHHEKKRFTRDRQAKVMARLREGASVEEIERAIDGAARAPHSSDDGVVYDDLELICRSQSKLDLFIARADAGQPKGPVPDDIDSPYLRRKFGLPPLEASAGE